MIGIRLKHVHANILGINGLSNFLHEEFGIFLVHASIDDLEDLMTRCLSSWESERELTFIFSVRWQHLCIFHIRSGCLLLELPYGEWLLPEDSDEAPEALLVCTNEAEAAELKGTVRLI